ncbi:MAG: zinc-dependent alcohol dehydrogenase family protein [bacterium]|nr:zinc-dependent alcohol dehydrogenase family protein [bacterium]
MKAMLLKNQAPIEEKPLTLTDVPIPEPGPGEVLLKVSVCGVCHTDLHTVEGDIPLHKTPIIPGHQVIGTVTYWGEGATRFEPGERVGIAWLHKACGECKFCERGDENLCLNPAFTGWDADGGFAEYVKVPERFAYRIPDEFEDGAAAPLLCGGIIGYRALKICGVKPGERLGLFGFGSSAHIAIQVARYRGCEVYVFSRSEEHRKLAEELGAVWTGRAEDTPPEKLDAAVNFTPAGSTTREALRATDRGGIVIMAGIHSSPVPELDYDEHLYWERSIKSVANATRKDGEELLKIAAEIAVKSEVTYYDLEQANQALVDMKQSKLNGAGVLRVG